MGFFTHEAAKMIGGRAQYITDTFESVCEDVSIEPCSEDLIEAGFDGIIAMNENYNSIMRRMAYAEASALEETGQEFVYTEGVIGDLYNTIKSFLMKVWERIKSLFKRFIMILDSYAKDDKAFAKKYQKEIFGKSGDTSDFSFKGYKWQIENSGFEAAMKNCSTQSQSHFDDPAKRNVNTTDHYKYADKAAYDRDVDKESDEMEKLRAEIFKGFSNATGYSQNSTMTSEEFRKEIHEIFRNGETEKEELEGKDIDVHDMYNKLIQSNQDRKTAKKGFDESKKSIDQDIKALERLHNENIKNAPGSKDESMKFAEDDVKAAIDSYNYNAGAKPKHSVDFKDGANSAIVSAVKKYLAANDDHATFTNGDGLASAFVKTDFAKSDTDEAARSRNDMRSKNLAYFAKYSRVSKECLLTINSELLNAVKERSRQYKACLIAYVHYRPSGESAMHESYLIGKEKNVGGNIFGGISFV